MIIETERLILRPWEETDAERLYERRNLYISQLTVKKWQEMNK